MSRWYRGTLRSCEVSDDETNCTGVVSFQVPHGVQPIVAAQIPI